MDQYRKASVNQPMRAKAAKLASASGGKTDSSSWKDSDYGKRPSQVGGQSPRSNYASGGKVKKAVGGGMPYGGANDIGIPEGRGVGMVRRAITGGMKKGGKAEEKREGHKKGGRVKGKTNINIVIGHPGAAASPAPALPPAALAALGAAKGGAGAPVAPSGSPAPVTPMGGMGMPIPGAAMPMARKSGGRTYTAGAMSGTGRLQKIAAYGLKPPK